MSEPKEISPIVGKIKGTDLKLYNWRGFGVIVGPGHSTAILDDIQHRINDVKQNMILVCGSPGEGKSYFALRLAQIFDPKFDPNLQIAFERSHLLYLFSAKSPLRMGSVIIIDEAQYTAGARSWYNSVQQDLMNNMEAIRSRGFLILIISLHLNLLDKVIRQYVLSCMMKMLRRGRAQVYELWMPTFANELHKKKIGRLALQLPDVEKCAYPSCLICKYIDKCMTIRAVYERSKTQFLNKMSENSQQKAEIKDRRTQTFDVNDMIAKLIAKKEEIIFTNNGTPEIESVKLILESYGLMLADTEARRIVKRGAILHPEVFKKPKAPKEIKE